MQFVLARHSSYFRTTTHTVSVAGSAVCERESLYRGALDVSPVDMMENERHISQAGESAGSKWETIGYRRYSQ